MGKTPTHGTGACAVLTGRRNIGCGSHRPGNSSGPVAFGRPRRRSRLAHGACLRKPGSCSRLGRSQPTSSKRQIRSGKQNDRKGSVSEQKATTAKGASMMISLVHAGSCLAWLRERQAPDGLARTRQRLAHPTPGVWARSALIIFNSSRSARDRLLHPRAARSLRA